MRQLLSDTLSGQRLARLAAAADCLTLPAQLLVAIADGSALPGKACYWSQHGPQPLSSHTCATLSSHSLWLLPTGPTSPPQPAAVCTAVLLFMQLSLGLLLPALLAAYTRRPAGGEDGGPGILAMPRVAHLQVRGL